MLKRLPLHVTISLVTVLAVAAIFAAVKYHQRFVNHCHNVLHGHVVTDTQTTYSTFHHSNGTTSHGSSTTSTTYCLSSTGGILDIEAISQNLPHV